MALKVYTKEYESKQKKMLRFFSYVILIAGVGMMFWAYYPMVSFEIYARFFIRKDTSSPIPETEETSSLQLAKSVHASNNFYSNNLRDFTQANVWFPVKNVPGANDTIDVQEYYLSIPKLNLENLKVTVGGEDLSKSLVHYLPTSKPGQYGKVAIFGHSTLPQLYNKNDYKTVFTYLPQMDLGDSINITIEGKEYIYEVYDMYIVKPDKVSVLEQNFNASYIMLVTCVPPGTYKERLIVEAKLKQHSSL
ncbi:MAG TPA: sortase [Candidatus Woesebacteria bacterium]|nr:sortase [Candidatus Woesebacteria bacterium]